MDDQFVLDKSNGFPTPGLAWSDDGTGNGVPVTVAAPGALANDQNSNGRAVTPILVGGPYYGSHILYPDGSFFYAPASEFFTGTDSFSYKLLNEAQESNLATVTLMVVRSDAPHDAEAKNDDSADVLLIEPAAP